MLEGVQVPGNLVGCVSCLSVLVSGSPILVCRVGAEKQIVSWAHGEDRVFMDALDRNERERVKDHGELRNRRPDLTQKTGRTNGAERRAKDEEGRRKSKHAQKKENKANKGAPPPGLVLHAPQPQP